MSFATRFLLVALVCACRGPEFVGGTAGGGGDDQGGGPVGAGPVGGAADGGGGDGAGPVGGSGGEGPVTVEVEFRDSDGGFMADRTVLLTDEDGAELQTSMLDADGRVTLEAMPRDMIYVFEPGSEEQPPRRVYGFEVTADTTSVRFVHPLDARTLFGTVTVTVNCSTGCTGATEAIVSLSCSSPRRVASPGTSFTVTFNGYRGCPGATAYDAAVVVRNASTVLAYDVWEDRTGTSVSLFTSVPDDVQSLEWTVTNVPDGLDVDRSFFALPADDPRPIVVAASDSASETITLSLVGDLSSPARAVAQVVDVTTLRLAGNSRSFATFDRPSLAFDAASLALPDDVTSFTVSAIDPASFDWTLGDGPLGDAILTSFSQLDGTGANVLEWLVMSPPASAGTMRLPELGAALIDYAITEEEIVGTGVGNVDLVAAADYAAVVADRVPFANEGPTACANCSYALEGGIFVP